MLLGLIKTQSLEGLVHTDLINYGDGRFIQ